MKKKILIVCICAFLALGISIRIWYVNAYPDPLFIPPKDEVYQMGEWVPLEGAFQFAATEETEGYFVKLEAIQFLKPEDYAKKYDIDIEKFKMGIHGELPEYVADLTLNFRNEGGDNGHIEFIYYRLYSNYDMREFYPLADVNAALHPEMGDRLGFKIRPGTESGPNHFCLISAVGTTGTTTGNLDFFPKHLQITITPVRKIIEIPYDKITK